MYEADARVELRKPRHSFLDAGHSNEDETSSALIEDCADLLETGHSEPVGLVDQYECGRLGHRLLSVRVLLEYFKVGRLERTDLSTFRQRGLCLAPKWSPGKTGDRLASTPKVRVNLRRGVHDRGSVEERIDRRKVLEVRAPGVKLVENFVAAIAER
jgi:hypothetical protein